EVFVDCPIETCEKRDQKGIYAKAKTGQIKNFTGISSPYETPEHPDITIRSFEMSPLDSASAVMRVLEDRKIVSKHSKSSLLLGSESFGKACPV
ncbi:MAG: adenylyl-sulfate kinase, partial [Deltaproteobacteria bacterium]|nr:adenylyl-sulfate kinase [Deltaproteobacteria bacterium]